MKTIIELGEKEIANAIRYYVMRMPKNSGRVISCVHLAFNQYSGEMTATAVMFDTEKAAREYLENPTKEGE